MYRKILLLFTLTTLLFSCSANTDFIGSNQVYQHAAFENFERTIKFPTFAPFEIDEVIMNIEYKGPIDLAKHSEKEIVNGLEEFADPEDRDDTENYWIITRYLSSDEKMVMEVQQASNKKVPVHSFEKSEDASKIDFGDGLEGIYDVHNQNQFFYWENDESTYVIIIHSPDNQNMNEETKSVSKDDIIKIAESFQEL